MKIRLKIKEFEKFQKLILMDNDATSAFLCNSNKHANIKSKANLIEGPDGG